MSGDMNTPISLELIYDQWMATYAKQPELQGHTDTSVEVERLRSRTLLIRNYPILFDSSLQCAGFQIPLEIRIRGARFVGNIPVPEGIL